VLNYLIFGIVYAFACVVQPGPFQAFLFSQSLAHGWRKTIPLVFAPLLSDWIVIILVLLALTNVPHDFLHVLQCCGGVFLLYLAYGAYKNWRTFNQNENKKVPVQQNIFKAVMVNFLNPNPYLGWSLVMGPMLIKGWNETPAYGIILLLAFYGTMIICSIGMIALFSIARTMGQRVIRASIGISVIALFAFGVFQLYFGIVG